jgi:uncharacterized protein YndB with AHSA1/START domain
MIDIVNELAAVHRATGHGRLPAGEGRTVTLRRRYDATVEDVWDAITVPDRLSRWFAPVTGDFRLGGTYQIKDNAGGEIVRCEPPRLLAVTWIFGDAAPGSSEVEVRLSAAGDEATDFELVHTAIPPEEFWSQFGPGAVGVGWDLALLGLALYLRGEEIEEDKREAWALSEEGRQFSTGSSQAWGAAYSAAGATPEVVAVAVENTTNFYAPAVT